MPGDAVLESTFYIIRQMEGFWQSCHGTRASEQERRQISIISDDGSFCARRLITWQGCIRAYRTHIVDVACHFDRACVQISVYEFQHFGCWCACFFTIERGRHVCESHSLEGSSDLFCGTARQTNNFQTIIAGTSHHDMMCF